jgi:hypothetical protein
MALLDFFNDIDGKREVAHGSDGRLNVSSRTDERIYYNSRDTSETFTFNFDDANADAADFVFYLKNGNTNGKHLIIHDVQIVGEAVSNIYKLHTISAVTSGGTAVTPLCSNRAAPKSASVTCLATTDSSGGTPMVLVSSGEIWTVSHSGGAYSGVNFELDDTLRLGQDQAVGLELDFTSTADSRVFGSVHFYFE